MVPEADTRLLNEAKTTATMRLVGGHPCLDFVNTVDARRDRWGPDLLRSYADLVVWAERVGLLDPSTAAGLRSASQTSPREAEQALAHARALREALHAILLCEVNKEAPRPDDLAFLNSAVASANAQRRLVGTPEGLGWAWRDGARLDAITHRIALAAAAFLLARPSRRLVRECPGPNCGWLFLDTSRGGRRSWCSDETCGSLTRVRRFRERRAS